MTGKIVFDQGGGQVDVPTPAAGDVTVFADTDSVMKQKDSTGLVQSLVDSSGSVPGQMSFTQITAPTGGELDAAFVDANEGAYIQILAGPPVTMTLGAPTVTSTPRRFWVMNISAALIAVNITAGTQTVTIPTGEWRLFVWRVNGAIWELDTGDRVKGGVTTTSVFNPALNAATDLATVDAFAGVQIFTSAAAFDQTIADPSNADETRTFIVFCPSTNTDPITVNGQVLDAGEEGIWNWDTLVWNQTFPTPGVPGQVDGLIFTDPAVNEATSTAVVDAVEQSVVTLTTDGNNQTIGDPTITGVFRVFAVANVLSSTLIPPASPTPSTSTTRSSMITLQPPTAPRTSPLALLRRLLGSSTPPPRGFCSRPPASWRSSVRLRATSSGR